jgi:hypothetical protein
MEQKMLTSDIEAFLIVRKVENSGRNKQKMTVFAIPPTRVWLSYV